MLKKFFAKLLFGLNSGIFIVQPIDSLFLFSFIETVDDFVITTVNGDIFDHFHGMKSNLTDIVTLYLFQVVKRRVYDFDVVLLVTFNAVGFDNLTAIG